MCCIHNEYTGDKVYIDNSIYMYTFLFNLRYMQWVNSYNSACHGICKNYNCQYYSLIYICVHVFEMKSSLSVQMKEKLTRSMCIILLFILIVETLLALKPSVLDFTIEILVSMT